MRRYGFLGVLAALTVITVFANSYFPIWTSPTQQAPAIAASIPTLKQPLTQPYYITKNKTDPFEKPLPKGLKWISHNKAVIIEEGTDAADAEEKFFEFVYQLHIGCSPTQRLGKVGDGGWAMCVASIYEPRSNCLVYSFGINYEWSFDDSISGIYGCTVRAFDPSMKEAQDHQRGNLIWFYKSGLGGTNEMNRKTKWPMHTFGSYLKMYGEEFTIVDYLKMDIEYFEWEALETMLQEGSLTRVKQLGVEIHTREALPGNPSTRTEDFVRYYQILKQLEDVGFVRWSSHFNPQGVYQSKRSGAFVTCCYEVVYLNTNFLPGRTNLLPPLNITSPFNPLHFEFEHLPMIRNVPAPKSHLPVQEVLPRDVIDDDDVVLAQGFHWVPPPLGMRFDLRVGMEPYRLESRFLQFIQMSHINCPKQKRVGNPGDGGWDVCLTSPYSLESPCLVYSFGIGRDWTFDDDISTEFGCHVNSFDPSLRKVKEHKRSEKIHFYPLGLSGANSVNNWGWKMFTLKEILRQLNDSQAIIDVLKIDIEYSEWSTLNASFATGTLRRVKQLIFEMHTKEISGPKDASTDQDLVFYWEVLSRLEEVGFRRWKAHLNSNGRYQSRRSNRVIGCCFELFYLNIHFMKHL